MTPADALAILTLAAQYDPTALPATPSDRRAKAQAWAAALPHLTREEATTTVIDHYRHNTRPLTVADLTTAHRHNQARATPHHTRGPQTQPCPTCGRIIAPNPNGEYTIPETPGPNGKYHTQCVRQEQLL